MAPDQFDAHLIWQAKRDLTRLLQPALTHAVLPGARIGGYAHPTMLDRDDAHAQGAWHFYPLVARKGNFAKNLSAAAYYRLFGQLPCPQGKREPYHANAPQHQRQPVTPSDQFPHCRILCFRTVHGDATVPVAAN